MKKSLFVIAIAVIGFTSSCKKDRVCECTYSSTAPGYQSSTSSYTILDARKKDAKVSCLSVSQTYTVNGTTITDKDECTLK
jgi:hypothetical protein